MGGEFINGESLTIRFSGGNGQYGGDGGDGGDGEDGLFSKPARTADTGCFFCKYKEILSLINLGFSHVFKCKLDSREIDSVGKQWLYRVEGEKRKSSGNGGDSGAGGMPGNAGNILFLGVKPTLKQINSKGNAGKAVRPGRAGKPGSNGPDSLYVIKSINTDRVDEYSNNLTNGVDGKVDSKDLKPAKSLSLSEIANIVVDYRGLLLENLDLSNTNDFKVQFYFSIEKNKHIMSMVDTLALVSEMKYLEKHFHKLHKSLNFLPLYQSLSNRTVRQKTYQSTTEIC